MLIKIFGIFVMLIFFTLLIISPNKSYAWSCANSSEPKELFKRHDSVFIGKAIKTSFENVGHLNPKSRVTFEVTSTLKGNSYDIVTVVTAVGGEFPEGKEYLVYAYKTTKDNYLYKFEEGELAIDTVCGGTKELSVAKNDLLQIDELKTSNKVFVYLIIAMISLLVIVSLIIILKRNR
ncbi:hypothetical protein R50345_25150 [Paenibacillus sp. FSL R5-0345]|nr:hypothetical protein R50345_25150 [Paenibacillus sp. FSL R5-0345]